MALSRSPQPPPGVPLNPPSPVHPASTVQGIIHLGSSLAARIFQASDPDGTRSIRLASRPVHCHLPQHGYRRLLGSPGRH
jgi:hypothetical protein